MAIVGTVVLVVALEAVVAGEEGGGHARMPSTGLDIGEIGKKSMLRDSEGVSSRVVVLCFSCIYRDGCVLFRGWLSSAVCNFFKVSAVHALCSHRYYFEWWHLGSRYQISVPSCAGTTHLHNVLYVPVFLYLIKSVICVEEVQGHSVLFHEYNLFIYYKSVPAKS